jgi:hypothetical protein
VKEPTTVMGIVCSEIIVTLIPSMSFSWTERVALVGKMRNAYRILVWKLQSKRPFGRHRLSL